MFDSDIDLLVDESLILLAEIKVLEEKRQKISKKFRDHLSSIGLSVYVTSKDQCIFAKLSLYPAYSTLTIEEKEAIICWLYKHRPELLTVSYSSLISNIATLPADFPVQFSLDGFVAQVSAKATTRLPQPLSEIMTEKIKRSPRVKNKTTKAVSVEITALEIPKPKALSRLEKIERRTSIIKDWMDGAKMSTLAKKHGLSAPYISEITRNYEKELVRTLIRRP